MATEPMKIAANDIVIAAAGVLGIIIVTLSIYWLFTAPADPASATIHKEIFDVVVRGTLLSLFTTIVGIKVAYTAFSYALRKFSDK